MSRAGVITSIVAQIANQSARNSRDRQERSTKERVVVAAVYEVSRVFEASRSLASKACEVTAAGAPGVTGASDAADSADGWKRVHARLKRIAKKRAGLDREELQLLRAAIRIALWRHVGATSIREYLENECGYGPPVASERVRVAEALDAMPALEHALGEGDLSYSAVRAVTRIATNRTERSKSCSPSVTSAIVPRRRASRTCA